MAKRTIIAVGEGIRREYAAAGTIKPGMVVGVGSAGTVTAWGTADTPNAPKVFAIENEIFGKGVSTGSDTSGDYSSGDRVLTEACSPGMEVNACVKGGAAAIVIGDPITVSNDGTVKKGTAAQAIGWAEEALDVSGDATTLFSHIRIRLV